MKGFVYRLFAVLMLVFLGIREGKSAIDGDSLMNELDKIENDTVRVNEMLKIIANNERRDITISKKLLLKCERDLRDLPNNKSKAIQLFNIAKGYEGIIEFEIALKFLNKVEDIIAISRDRSYLVQINNERGTIYWHMNLHGEAKKYYKIALSHVIKTNDRDLIGETFYNYGWMLMVENICQNAIDTLQLALGFSNKLENMVLNGLAASFIDCGKPDSAIVYYKKCIENVRNNKNAWAPYSNLADLYLELKDFAHADLYLDTALMLIDTTLNKKALSDILLNKYEIYKQSGNLVMANKFLDSSYVTYKKQIAQTNIRTLADMQTKYDTDIKDGQIKFQQLEIENKNTIIYSVAVGLLITASLTLIAYRSYRQKNKANKLLTTSKKIIEHKNKEIQDSINYAQRIQKAILPNENQIAKSFTDFFCLYLPKDIVSGDFYWFAEHNDKKLVAVVDCTGHGVPGAFMSMIGADMLNNIVYEKNTSEPGEILRALNNAVKNALKQTENSESKDGMDIALCVFDKDVIKYAGANRPLYYVQNNELFELTPTKQAIGGNTPLNASFSTHVLTADKNSMIYLFSDGYADQFGGEKGKKFMTRNFKQLLVTLQSLNGDEQKRKLISEFINWKGNNEQVDDILVIGIKV